MANLKITIEGALMDGHQLTFKAPCDCTSIDKLDVHYVENLEVKNMLFDMKDTHGNTLAGLGNLFESGAYVHVILNKTDRVAYIQNADTNGYLEKKFSALYSEKVNYTDVVDNLLSTATDLPLSANQGQVLNNKVDNLLSSHFHLIDNYQDVATSTTMSNTGVYVTIPANSYYSIQATAIHGQSQPTGVAISNSPTNVASHPFATGSYVRPTATTHASGYVEEEMTFYLWASYSDAKTNGVFFVGFYVTV